MSDRPPGAAESLRARGLRPKKSLGQNFLRDRSYLPRIVAAADITEGDRVLEVGPGTGVLTEALLGAGAQVTAVELDDRLYEALSERYGADTRVRLIHADALTVLPETLFDGPYKLVANIPYYITGPLTRHYLEAALPPSRIVMMVQREVARRMAAVAGDMSLLGVSVQYYARARIAMKVPAQAFYPRPKVDSAVVVLEPYRQVTDESQRTLFFDVVRAGFHVRRKQLANALSGGLGIGKHPALRLLAEAKVDPTRRAEELDVDEWERIARVWDRMREASG